jgi:hypothetical protein
MGGSHLPNNHPEDRNSDGIITLKLILEKYVLRTEYIWKTFIIVSNVGLEHKV